MVGTSKEAFFWERISLVFHFVLPFALEAQISAGLEDTMREGLLSESICY